MGAGERESRGAIGSAVAEWQAFPGCSRRTKAQRSPKRGLRDQRFLFFLPLPWPIEIVGSPEIVGI